MNEFLESRNRGLKDGESGKQAKETMNKRISHTEGFELKQKSNLPVTILLFHSKANVLGFESKHLQS
jgi:hypothetical protein